MTIVTSWRDLVDEVVRHFPESNGHTLLSKEGDIGALVMHLSETHELTFAEAAEMVAIRLPVYLEEEQRLSA